ncbi:flavodoxin [Bacillus coahuilensis p1.1.43]|uniref:Flavodoxin n=1 Tax=Bacillus coahuilensis p1.1.43 TaxID=1150625 RepID=A0A147KAV1_9BACI|nr:flavodoxin [Bacillus coahuilensis]KUP07866.1 flavodoxin [Bacillus coahuilensis p1.1.43]
MKSVAIVYASMSGNTEAIADIILEKLKSHPIQADLLEIVDLDSATELQEYDMVFLGLYTWGDGEYPDESLDLVEELEELNLSSKAFALFGSGDHSYPHFCGAVDMLEELIENRGGVLAAKSLKIELSPNESDEKRIEDFVNEAWNHIQKGAAVE